MIDWQVEILQKGRRPTKHPKKSVGGGNSMKDLRSRGLQFFAIGSIVVFAALTTPASAAPVCSGALLMNAGDTVVMGAGAFGDCTGTAVASTLLASHSAPFTSSTGYYSGTLISAVYQETGSGTLDFYYQVVLNTTSTNCGGGGQPTCDH